MPGRRRTRRSAPSWPRCATTPRPAGLTSRKTGSSPTRGIPAPRSCAPGAGGAAGPGRAGLPRHGAGLLAGPAGPQVRLPGAADRGARPLRASRVEFVKGPRGDSPEDQLLVQFQGMFAEYEKAQLMERYRRGKAWRAKTGSVNVLGGAPFGYRYVRKTPESGARYEVVGHEAVLVVGDVPPLRRRRRRHRRPSAAGSPPRASPPAPARNAGTGPSSGACSATPPTPAPRCSARPGSSTSPPG